MREVDAKIHEICANIRNVTMLSPISSLVLPNDENPVQFIGCALWTESSKAAEMQMNDYKTIYAHTNNPKPTIHLTQPDSCVEPIRTVFKPFKRQITHDDITALHKTHRSYLVNTLSKSVIPTVVVTHHAPTFKMLRSGSGSRPESMRTLYATDLEHLFVPPLVGWISGHTHNSTQQTIGEIPCVSNCFGYPFQDKVYTKYSPKSVLLL
jgi:hypothetical protein